MINTCGFHDNVNVFESVAMCLRIHSRNFRQPADCYSSTVNNIRCYPNKWEDTRMSARTRIFQADPQFNYFLKIEILQNLSQLFIHHAFEISINNHLFINIFSNHR